MRNNLLILLTIVSVSCEEPEKHQEDIYPIDPYPACATNGYGPMHPDTLLLDLALRFRDPSKIDPAKSKIFVKLRENRQGIDQLSPVFESEAQYSPNMYGGFNNAYDHYYASECSYDYPNQYDNGFSEYENSNDSANQYGQNGFNNGFGISQNENHGHYNSNNQFGGSGTNYHTTVTTVPATVDQPVRYGHSVDQRFWTVSLNTVVKDVSSEYILTIWVDSNGNSKIDVGDFISERAESIFIRPSMSLRDHVMSAIVPEEPVENLVNISFDVTVDEAIETEGLTGKILVEVVRDEEGAPVFTESFSVEEMVDQLGQVNFKIPITDETESNWQARAWIDTDDNGLLDEGEASTGNWLSLEDLSEDTSFELEIHTTEGFENTQI